MPDKEHWEVVMPDKDNDDFEGMKKYANKYAERLSAIRNVLRHIDLEDMTQAERTIWAIINNHE